MKIRSDLKGVVYVQSEGGVACLAAGDTVPDGVDVGEHLTAEPEDGDEDDLDEKGTEHARGRRGRRSTPRPESDA